MTSTSRGLKRPMSRGGRLLCRASRENDEAENCGECPAKHTLADTIGRDEVPDQRARRHCRASLYRATLILHAPPTSAFLPRLVRKRRDTPGDPSRFAGARNRGASA